MGCRSAFAAAVWAVLTATALIGPGAASPQGAKFARRDRIARQGDIRAGGCFCRTTSCPG